MRAVNRQVEIRGNTITRRGSSVKSSGHRQVALTFSLVEFSAFDPTAIPGIPGI